MTEFKHPPTPPALPGDFIPVAATAFRITRTYADVPGALRMQEDLIERELLAKLEPVHGHEKALEALGRIRWTRTPPHWPGDNARLDAEVTVYVRADVTPNGHQY